MDATSVVVSIVTDVFAHSLAGHPYETCLAVQKAAGLAGCNHAAAVPVSCPIRPLPDGWSACLHYTLLPKDRIGVLRDAISVLPLAFDIVAFMQSVRARYRAQPIVVYYEWFKPPTLAAFMLAMLFTIITEMVSATEATSHQTTVWLCVKGRIDLAPGSGLYRFIIRLLRAGLGDARLRVHNDNAHAIPAVSTWLGMPVYPIPIPHTAETHTGKLSHAMEAARHDGQVGSTITKVASSEDSPSVVVCWWPGSPSAGKGWDEVRRLVASTAEVALAPWAGQIVIAAAEAAGLVQVHGGCHIIQIADELLHDDYRAALFSCDVVLLPYHPVPYKHRTSGIFVEAVVAGRLPVASADTWLADELRAYHLDELVIDWSCHDLPMEIMRLVRNVQVRRNLEHMTEAYRRYHSPAGLAMIFKQLHMDTLF